MPNSTNILAANDYDGTHLTGSGHVLFARAIVGELRKAVPELSPLLLDEPVAAKAK